MSTFSSITRIFKQLSRAALATYMMFTLPLNGEEPVLKNGKTIQTNLATLKRAPLGKKRPHTNEKQTKKARKAANIQKTKSWHNRSKISIPFYGVKSIGYAGKTIAMNDETVWTIANQSQSTASAWSPNDTIIIKPNKGFLTWFSKEDYQLHNVDRNQYVEADLSQGPFLKYSVFIQYINTQQGTILLTDGSLWTVSRSSIKTLSQWQTGQAVLFGQNNGWWELPYILININENQYLTVECIRVS